MKKIFIMVFLLLLGSIFNLKGQELYNFNEKGKNAFSQGALYASAYLLYSDYIRNPETFADYEITSYLLAKTGQIEESKKLLSNIIDLNQSDSLKHYIYLAKAHIAFAEQHYNQSLSFLSDVPTNDETIILKATCYVSLEDYDKAIELATNSIKTNPTWELYGSRGLYYSLKGDYVLSNKDMNKALEIRPHWPFAYYIMGQNYEKTGDYYQSIKCYTMAIENRNDAIYLLSRGKIYKLLGRNNEANADFQSILRLDKTLNKESIRHWALYYLGEEDSAISWLNKLNNNNYNRWYDLACIYSRTGNIEESLKAISIAFKNGYSGFKQMKEDEDLAATRIDPKFTEMYDYYLGLFLNK